MAKHLKQYQWYGLDYLGNRVKGTIEATDLASAKYQLRQQHIDAYKIYRKILIPLKPKCKQTDITFFYQKLATISKAGIPLILALNTLFLEEKKPAMRQLIQSVIKSIESGHTFREALTQHPEVNDSLCINLINIGEKTATLATMLEKIAIHKAHTQALKNKIIKALIYPFAIILMTFFVMVLMTYFVIPQFKLLYVSFGAKLPLITEIILSITELFKIIWFFLLMSMFALFYLFSYLRRKSVKFLFISDSYLLNIPILGTFLKKACIIRFISALSITVTSGLPLFEALDILKDCTGNQLFANKIQKIREKIASGQPLNQAIKFVSIFPMIVSQMIMIGEESGSLGTMLNQVTEIFEEKTRNEIELLIQLLEPTLMIILGLLVGVLVIAIYLPIFKMGALG